MGSLAAADFANQVNEGNIQLRTAISWHLTSNHYPPHPAFMVDPVVAAVLLARDEEWDTEIDLPKGCETHNALVPYGQEHCTFGESDEDKADFGACVLVAAVEWQDRTDGKASVSDIIESFHLDSFV
jgi:hypothetical protein